MTVNPDDIVVLCTRVEDGPSGVAGSTKEICCQCLRQVWLSPATRATVERKGRNTRSFVSCVAKHGCATIRRRMISS